MTKAEFVEAIAQDAGLSKAAAEKAVSAFVSVVTEALKEDEKVTLFGFGTFEVRERAAHSGRNPATGETIKIAASKVPAFKTSKALKDALN